VQVESERGFHINKLTQIRLIFYCRFEGEDWRTRSLPLVGDLHIYMCAQAARAARGDDLVKAINYILKSWTHPTQGRNSFLNAATSRSSASRSPGLMT
jgi:hypothetical protein